MFKNFIVVGWRNIRNNLFYSALNSAGLSVGLAFALLIGVYAWKETRVNKELSNYKNQYIIQSKWTEADMGLELTTSGPLAKALKEQYPSLIKNYYRWDGITSNVSKGDKVFREGLQVGDSTLLHMYGFQLLHGNASSALTQPYSVVIREDKARKYFGRTDVVGETLTIQSFSGTRHDFIITGVMQYPEENSVTNVNAENDNAFFIPVSSMEFFGRNLDAWNNIYIAAYVELQKGVDPETLVQPMESLLKKNAPSQVSAHMHPYLVPLENYYLQKDKGLVKKMLFTVSAIAFFILVMAIVNFVNVSIAKSSGRLREIGVRKVMGGKRKQLILQFLTESTLLVLMATILALGIYEVARPYVSDILGKKIESLSAFTGSFIFIPLAVVFLVGTSAGFYPALVLSAQKTVDSLKGKLKSTDKILLRKFLVGFQFFIASLVLIGAFVITKQVRLFFTKDLGFDKSFVVSAQVPRDWSDAGVQRMQTIRNEFERLPQVSAVSLSYQVPNGWENGTMPVYKEGADSTDALNAELLMCDEKYTGTFKIPVVAGHYFSSVKDTNTIVLNELAVQSFGWKDADDAIGKRVYIPGNFPMNVIGVVKNFHSGSMKDKMQPAVIIHVGLFTTYRFLSFKLHPGNISDAIAALQKKWNSLLPGSAFEYNFIDEGLERIYHTEIQLKKAAQLATILALLIAVLGIIGLLSISIHKRAKEIGIRKVLGASSGTISYLFLKDFLPVILLGSLISVPIAWYVMRGWLNDYAYRIALTSQPFLVSIFAFGILSSILIVIQTSRKAMENPVKHMRAE